MQQVGQGWLALELTTARSWSGWWQPPAISPFCCFRYMAVSWPTGGASSASSSSVRRCCLIEAAALWWFTWAGRISIGWLLALTTLGGVISAFEIPARQSMIVELVSKEDLVDAIALNSGGFNLARIVGRRLPPSYSASSVWPGASA